MTKEKHIAAIAKRAEFVTRSPNQRPTCAVCGGIDPRFEPARPTTIDVEPEPEAERVTEIANGHREHTIWFKDGSVVTNYLDNKGATYATTTNRAQPGDHYGHADDCPWKLVRG